MGATNRLLFRKWGPICMLAGACPDDFNCWLFQQFIFFQTSSLYSTDAPLDGVTADLVRVAATWFVDGFCGLFCGGNTPAFGVGAGRFGACAAQSESFLARCLGCKLGQYTGRSPELVDGAGIPCCGRQIPSLVHPPSCAGLVEKNWPQSLPVVLVAGCRRPFVCCGRLAQI